MCSGRSQLDSCGLRQWHACDKHACAHARNYTKTNTPSCVCNQLRPITYQQEGKPCIIPSFFTLSIGHRQLKRHDFVICFSSIPHISFRSEREKIYLYIERYLRLAAKTNPWQSLVYHTIIDKRIKITCCWSDLPQVYQSLLCSPWTWRSSKQCEAHLPCGMYKADFRNMLVRIMAEAGSLIHYRFWSWSGQTVVVNTIILIQHQSFTNN